MKELNRKAYHIGRSDMKNGNNLFAMFHKACRECSASAKEIRRAYKFFCFGWWRTHRKE